MLSAIIIFVYLGEEHTSSTNLVICSAVNPVYANMPICVCQQQARKNRKRGRRT